MGKSIDIKKIPLQSYVDRLRSNQYFSFARYGDGEWRILIKGCGLVACRLQVVNPQMQVDMIRSLTVHVNESGLIFGMQNYAVRIYGHLIPIFLQKYKLEDIHWTEADVFHYASRDGLLYPLIKQLREMKVVIVGPSFLRKLSKRTFNYTKFIEVRPKNCYAQQPIIKSNILKVHTELKENVVYSFCCGPLAETLILDLHSQMSKNFLIDFGSVWDVFCGWKSRGYTMKPTYTNKIFRGNLGLRR